MLASDSMLSDKNHIVCSNRINQHPTESHLFTRFSHCFSSEPPKRLALFQKDEREREKKTYKNHEFLLFVTGSIIHSLKLRNNAIVTFKIIVNK